MKGFMNISFTEALVLTPDALLTYFVSTLEWHIVQARTDVSYRDRNYRHAEVMFTLANVYLSSYFKIKTFKDNKVLNNSTIKRDMQLYLAAYVAYEHDYSYTLPYADMFVEKFANNSFLEELRERHEATKVGLQF